jgi:hypothetical protein
VSPSVHVWANCAADVMADGERRMELRPYGIGEIDGYVGVVDQPRPPSGAKQSALQSIARSRLALPSARSERSTGARLPVGTGGAVGPGRSGDYVASPATYTEASGPRRHEWSVSLSALLQVVGRLGRDFLVTVALLASPRGDARRGARSLAVERNSIWTIDTAMAAELGGAWPLER